MRSLQESLLDDEDILMDDTDIKKNFKIPEFSDYKRIMRMPPKYIGYTYEWISPLLKLFIKNNKNMDLTGLYIYWTKYTGNDIYPYYSVYIKPKIGNTYFNNNFRFFGVSSNTLDKKYTAAQAKKLAYQLIKCIAKHPGEILNLVLDANDKYIADNKNIIYIEDIVDEYK